MDSRTVGCYVVGYAEKSRGYKFYDKNRRMFFETGTSRLFEDVELGERDKENKDSFFAEEENQKSGSQREMVLIPPITVIEDSTANQEGNPDSHSEQVMRPQEQFHEESQQPKCH